MFSKLKKKTFRKQLIVVTSLDKVWYKFSNEMYLKCYTLTMIYYVKSLSENFANTCLK